MLLSVKDEVEDLRVRLLNSLGYYDDDIEILPLEEIKERYWSETFKRGSGVTPY